MYDNWCQKCEATCTRILTLEVLGLQPDSYLPSKQSLLKELHSLENAKLKIDSIFANCCSKVSTTLSYQYDKVALLTQRQDRIKKVQDMLKVFEYIEAHKEKMSSWLPYIGKKCLGRIGPMSNIMPITDTTIVCSVLQTNTYIGEECERFSSLKDIESLVIYHRALYQECLAVEKLDVKGQYSEIIQSLKGVLDTLHIKIMKLMLIPGYKEVRSYDVRNHIHYSKQGEKYGFIPFVINDVCGVKVFKAYDGYIMFIKEGELEPIKELMDYMGNNPFNHIHWTSFKNMDSESVDPTELLSRLSKDIDLLYETRMYRQLLGALSIVEYQSSMYYRLLSYLKLAHFYQYQERPSCRVFLMAGPAGVGKSYDVDKIAGRKKNVYYYSYDHKTKQYFDGYRGQSIMVIDDIGHYTSAEWLILLRLVSDIPFTLPMAAADVKDKIPSLVEEVYITTNHLDKLLSLDKDTRDAICRRLEVIRYTEDGKREFGVYNKLQGNFHYYTSMDRDSMMMYFHQYVQSRRQEPRCVSTGLSHYWDYLEMGIGVLSKWRSEFSLLCPLIGLVKQFVTDTVTFSSVNGVTIQIGNVIGDVIGKIMNVTRLRQLNKKSKLNAKERKYVKHQLKRPGSLDIRDELLAKAEGNILCHDVVGKNTPIQICGKILEPFDLQPYVKKYIKKDIYKVEGREKFSPREIELMPELVDFKEQKPYTAEVITSGYKLVGLPDELKKWYKEGVFFKQFAPLADSLVYEIDESEYRPFMPIQHKINKDGLNKLLHVGSPGNRTNKRKLERLRQRQRSLNQQ